MSADGSLSPDDFERLYGRHLREGDGDRPWVYANTVMGADGAATLDGRAGELSDALDHQLLLYLRSTADVLLVGAETVRVENYGPTAGTPLAIVTASGDLDYRGGLFTDPVVPPLLLVPDERAMAIARRAGDRAEVVAAGSGAVDLKAAMLTLHERGARHVLTEGGPSLLSQLVAAHLVDELCLTLSPVIGGEDLRVMDASGHSRRLRLAHVVAAAGHLYVRYLFR